MIKLLVFISVFHLIYSWSDHDTSTLKLLQILHRHGDRTPTKFVDGDPFGQDMEKYWPIGKGQLTLKGKHRLYSLGQFFRKSYSDFFNKTSPKQVYVRSSIEHRCIESAGAFLAGAFPPGKVFYFIIHLIYQSLDLTKSIISKESFPFKWK